jgi:hypothetical protein
VDNFSRLAEVSAPAGGSAMEQWGQRPLSGLDR